MTERDRAEVKFTSWAWPGMTKIYNIYLNIINSFEGENVAQVCIDNELMSANIHIS